MADDTMPRPRAFALVTDLMLKSRVKALAEEAGLEVKFFGEPDALFDSILDAEAPDLLILDLSDRAGWGMQLLERMQTTGPPPTLGFYAHVEVDVRRRALALGATRVVPRSVLVKKFADLVRETIAA